MYTATKQQLESGFLSIVGKAENTTEEQITKDDDQETVIVDKLHRLQIDCSMLNKFIEQVLLSSGICKRYTYPHETAFCNFNHQQTRCKTKKIQLMKPDATRFYQPMRPRRSTQILVYPSVPREKPRIYKHAMSSHQVYASESTPSFDRYTVATFQRIWTSTHKSKTPSKWIPRVTVPQPFKMTLREQQQRARSTYSKRFLEKQLKEKREKQLADLREHQKIFKANPIPKTTYTPSLPAKIGVKSRSKSVGHLRNASQNDTTKKPRSNPVPLSTFFRPITDDENQRKQRRFQRALALLVAASEPGHMKEHSVRWQVQQRLRHMPKCYQRQDLNERIRSKSVPDFRRMHRHLEAKLQELKLFRPATLVEPFRFSDDYPRHCCGEWTFANEKIMHKERKHV